MSFRKTVAAGWVALTLSAVAIAQAEQIGQLSISQPWTRATPPKAQTAGNGDAAGGGWDHDSGRRLGNPCPRRIPHHVHAVE